MKISWGWKIAALYVGFAIMISVLAFKSMQQHFDLTDKDYYAEEIAYQHVLDAGKNQSALSAPVLVQHQQDAVYFSFPEEFRHQTIKGSIHFYAPVKAAWDAQFDLQTDNGSFSVPPGKLQPTRYEIKISWEAGGKNYYQETSINLAHS